MTEILDVKTNGHHEKNNLTTREIPNEISITQKILHGFLTNYKSPHTRNEYQHAVTEFFHFIKHDITHISDLRTDHLIAYKNSFTDKGLANKTILKKMSAISSMCKHLGEEQVISKDITYGLRRPTTRNKKETADFTDDEVKRIFAGLDPTKYNYYQYRAIMAVGFYTGLRSEEIRSLRIENLGEIKGHRVISCVIKGDKNHEVVLNPFVVNCLKEHIDNLEKMGFKIDSRHYLFPSLKPKVNKPYTREGMSYILKSVMKSAGIEGSHLRRYSPHSMRATFAGHLLNTVEAPLEDVQKLMGHASPTTTKKYDKREKSRDRSPIYKMCY